MTYMASANGQQGQVGYVVRLDVFEGPLDLLLHLIEREELDITAIAMAQVTDQYLAYLAQAEWVSPAVMADFVAMAARLLLIKSRALLPAPAGEEEEEEEDPAEALARQLREYKQFREVAQLLGKREKAHWRAYIRLVPTPQLERRLKPGEASLEDLLAAVKQALQARQGELPATTVVTPYTITIQDKITLLRDLLRHQPRVRFHELLDQAQNRQEIIVTLLAVLELIKQEEIRARQDTLFGPIIIEAVDLLPASEPATDPARTWPA